MNTNSNTYTVIYSVLLTLVVAAVLAFVSSSLRGRQNENIATEKKQSILKSAALGLEKPESESLNSYIDKLYKEYIVDEFVLNTKGEKLDNENVDLKAQYDIMRQITSAKDQTKAEALREKLRLPVFVCSKEGKTLNIFPCYGAGLWGPIWGYIAVEDDFNTIYGVAFDHKGETPGLGAEIANNKFTSQFPGKKLYDENGNFVSVAIVKGGGQQDNPNGVDAVSGGTITSTALQNTIASWFAQYLAYFEVARAAKVEVPAAVEGEELETTASSEE